MALHRVHVRFSLLFMIFTLALTTRVTLGANDKDKEECTEQLVGLATCLPYVGGNAKSPTPDCCTGLKQVLNTNKKCLCVVIKDRNDPDLGLTINVTLALGLPDVCHTPANVTKCPALTTRVTLGANDKDKEECTEQLVGLATCLPYVGGNAKSPTPDCCTGLKQVLNTNKKCLCVVIKDRNDPDLGLTINVTLALGLPDVCHTPANVTKCPELLKLDPNSPEAQVFYQFGHSSSGDAPASSPSASANARARGSGTRSYRPTGTATGLGNDSATLSKHKIILMGVISCIFSFTFVM
ncbi:bifunctional inhibitor/lipid-transfer protein/seed storage 2S albumin superfamily protein [Artemisia annua]|uniref:Bifunctional inhibitor/lipid-transfer protein/seed storage 2S albumin superfamily protein n=1 Tax=Artemisia annua TaxID=35608 RepID=A0A2U1LSI9_ARTAN|nr:bifunctional inhibitor/lipid-transfer protein/seed storage 2S albumin superfamily protein [Artemisia annua]